MKNEFDHWLKAQWARKEFPVNPDHRAAMERMLPVQKRRRVIAWWWWGGGIAVGIIFFMLLAPGMDAWMRPHTPAPAPVPESTNPGQGETPDPARDLQPGDVAGAYDTHTADADATGAPADPAQAMLDGAMPHNANDVKANLTEARTKPSPIPERNTPPRAESNSQSAGSPGNASRKEADRKPDVAGILTDDRVIADPTTPATEFTPPQRSGSSIGIEANAEAPESGARDLPADAIALEAQPSLTRHMVMVPEITPVALRLAVPPPASPVVQAFESSPRNAWYAFAEAGGSYVPAMANRVPAGHVLAAGIGVGIRLAPSLDIQALGGYALQDGGFRFERMSTVRQPGFGARSSFHELTPERLHFVNMKVGVVYRLRRHLLMARGGGMYLYGAQGTVTVQTNDQFHSMLTPVTTSGWLNTSGMRRWQWTGEAAYGYQFTPRWSVLAGAAWRPGDIALADVSLADAGYYWQGRSRTVHPFVSMQYRIYGN